MQTFLFQCQQAVLDGDRERAKVLAAKAVEEGRDLMETIERGFSVGIREAGKRWEEGLYFLPELAFSAEAMKAAMAVLHPVLEDAVLEGKGKGVVVIGTVQGDIHDIGKTLVATLLAASGYEVIDLGGDVAHERFVEEVSQRKPDFLCMSALLTTTMVGQRRVIELLDQAGLREDVRVVVGGAPTSTEWARDIMADGYAPNAVAAVHLLEKLG